MSHTDFTCPPLFSPVDDGIFLEHTPPSSSSGEGDGGGGEVTVFSSTPSTPVLAPSLTPASQPTISLLTDNNTDALSVESLTLLPPADSPHLHPCASYVPMTHSLQRPDASIPEEEEEKEGDEKGELRDEELLEEEGSTMDETIKEENTTAELSTPTDEAPEGDEPEGEDTMMPPEGDDTALVDPDLSSGVEMQGKDDLAATEDAERHSKMPDSPELD